MKLGYRTSQWSFIANTETGSLNIARIEPGGIFRPYEQCVLSRLEKWGFQEARDAAIKAFEKAIAERAKENK